MYLKYTVSGHLFISPEDDCQSIVDAMLATGYNEEFCVAIDFNAEFIARLMEAGFLVMSADIAGENEQKPNYILLPKLHLERSALFFENLHIKRTIRRFLNRYELRPDVEFDYIIDHCVEKHGADWLTPPLVQAIKNLRRSSPKPDGLLPTAGAYPASFAVYRDGKFAAGEFGVVCGRVYTSYSGFYDEDNAGTVQLILTTQYLQEQGFSFFDMGMPLDYKTALGAVDISPEEFVKLFRA
ncbi:MAG: GNAT family N-acetyltransferase [Spirochaetes bacterium]|nr:GNAT family N-acetyltransferase [Spirochaetota bacterium]